MPLVGRAVGVAVVAIGFETVEVVDLVARRGGQGS